MKKTRRLTAAAAALTLLLGLSACSGGDKTAEVESAFEKLRAAESFQAVHVTEREEVITSGEETMTFQGTSRLALTVHTVPNPQLMAETTATVTASNGQSQEQTTIIYVMPEANGGYSQYITDGTVWYKSTQEESTALEGMSAGDVIELFVSEGLTYRQAGSETLESGPAKKYETTRTGADLVAMLEDVGLLNNIQSMSESQQQRIKEGLGKLKGQSVFVWIDEATGYPVRFEADLTALIPEITKSISDTLGGYEEENSWTQTKSTIRLDVSLWNEAPEVVLPPEAASAQDFSSLGGEAAE